MALLAEDLVAAACKGHAGRTAWADRDGGGGSEPDGEIAGAGPMTATIHRIRLATLALGSLLIRQCGTFASYMPML
jgi:hypothetical protein